jgi:tetratricopeptide (TPR) repeat protein
MTSLGESTWVDRLIACAWAFAVGIFAFVLNDANYISASSADSLLVAFGSRPPENAFPLLWHNLVFWINSYLGISNTMRCLYILGPISIALFAFISTGLFSLLLPLDLRTIANSRRWGRKITYILPVLGSAVFVFSTPVWSLGEVFLPETFAMLLFLAATYFVARAFCRFSSMNFIVIGIISGVLASQTPIGFLIPLCVAIYLRCSRNQEEEVANFYLANPLLQSVLTKWMLLAFVAFWVAGLSLNLLFFFSHNAEGAQGGIFLQIVRLFKHYGISAYSAMDPLGWAFAGMLVVAPFVFAFVRVKRATDTKNFLFVRHSFFFFVFGVIALLQSSSFSTWWFWRLVSDEKLVSSDFLLGVCLLGSAYTAFAAICVFVVDVYFRNARTLAREFFWDEVPDMPMILKIKRRLVLSGRFFRLVLMSVIVAAVASVVFVGRINPTEKRIKAIVNEFVGNVVRECSDTPILITDGSFDALIELAAALEGKEIKTLSMMSGSSKYEAMLRRRVDGENKYRSELTSGAADALRVWMRDDSPIISNLAIQVGFELWRNNNKRMPKCGGFLAKSGEVDFDTTQGVEAAYSLADKILAFRKECDISEVDSTVLRSALSRIQWRLSRMCIMRAYLASRDKDASLAKKENDLADRLEEANSEWLKAKKIEEECLSKNTSLTLTPREGLNISLKRADFRLANSYAKKVIVQDENDVSANFALGMDSFMNHRYDKAEEYLKRALKNAPNEPAILNNLAVILIRLDRFDEAETNALKALEVLPKSQEIQETLRRIRQLKAGQK